MYTFMGKSNIKAFSSGRFYWSNPNRENFKWHIIWNSIDSEVHFNLSKYFTWNVLGICWQIHLRLFSRLTWIWSMESIATHWLGAIKSFWIGFQILMVTHCCNWHWNVLESTLNKMRSYVFYSTPKKIASVEKKKYHSNINPLRKI